MKGFRAILAALAASTAALVFVSCASLPAKRADTVMSGATAGDLDAPLAEVSVSALLSRAEIERLAREVFPLAVVKAGIAPAKGEGRADYALWIYEEEYSIGIDRYSAIFCLLKLRSKDDGSILATTIVMEDMKRDLRSSSYVYDLLRKALVSLRRAAPKSRIAAKVAGE
jgi:hypothetical protein